MHKSITSLLLLFLFAFSSLTTAQDNVRETDIGGTTVYTVPNSGGGGYESPKAVLFDNGPYFNVAGGGPVAGSDLSLLESTTLGMTTLGAGHALSAGIRVADDFTIPSGETWTISTASFYAYQTGSTTTSTINHLNVRIWDGPPGEVGSNIVFGDSTTNVLATTEFSNAYRHSETAVGTTRPIMKSTATIGTTLTEGTYWIDWQCGGTLASGPWAPPIAILGQNTTGNAKQSIASVWADLNDGGTLTPQGLPFILDGTTGGGETTLFFDDFESGTTQWTLTGTWGLTELQSVSPTHSLTESPVGNYGDNLNITATMATSLDLSSYLGAEVSFWARYSIEQGFDYMYLQVSPDNGTTWLTQEAFNEENVPWTQYTYDLGGFVGNPNVLIRFRFFSDGGYNVDGMYIDDFTVTGSTVDLSPPLIVHSGPEFYEGVIGDFTATTNIIDISGIQSATLYYTVDGGSPISVVPSSVVGDVYTFTIPSTIPGSNIDYYIEATDNQSNTTVNPPVYSYISGTYIKYDDPTVDFVTNFGPLSGQLGAAVRMTVPAGNPGNLVTALIRNYTDINRPNSDMEFHVWANNGGIPGADLITPFLVTPEATVANTSPMTRIDLRPYFTQLSGLTGDFWIGFMVPQDTVWITIKQPGAALRSFYNNGTTWVVYTNTDFHFRCVLGDERNVPVELTSFTANVTQGNVVLNWTTATEINNQGFEVQKRTVNGQYSIIGHVQGNGTTTEIKNYSFTDAGVALGTYYYRLKQVDFNGDFEFSNEIFVDVNAPLEFALAQNYPNPFNPTTSINFSIAEPTFVKLAIYNLLGEEVQVLKNDYMEAGTFKINFDASSLPSGMYLYKIETAQYSSIKKMMLMK